MRATLLYNARAGHAEPEHAIVAGLARIGWSVTRRITRDDLDEHLQDDTDVIVVAGGDGTVGRVAKRLVGKETPMAIVPMGTANNVARSLGVGITPLAAISGLARAIERRVDLGVVRSGDDSELVLEGLGVGVFARVVGEKASSVDKDLDRARSLVARELEEHTPRHYDIEADGRDLSGTYVLAAAMNARSLGPALDLAPDAKLDDGELDLVLVPPAAKDELVRYVGRPIAADGALRVFHAGRASHVRIRSDGRWMHVDECARRLDGEITVDVARGALRVLA
jgi:diacylglycerol kinase family enzyme